MNGGWMHHNIWGGGLEGQWGWDPEMLGQLKDHGTHGVLRVWVVRRSWSLQVATAPTECVMGWARQQKKDGNNFYYCRQEGGRWKNTGCTWETRLSFNSDTLKAPPTLMTFFSPKQLKFGSGGGSNRLKGKGVRDRQLTENWGLCLFLISEARGQCQRSQALRPLLTSSWHLNCEFCLLLMMLLIS